MPLVEQTIIRKGDPRYDIIDHAAFASKNLYNAALYEMRQEFIFGHCWLCYETVYHRMKTHEAYRALPTKVAQQVMRLLDKNWKSYFEACKAYEEHPEQFQGHPKLPKYKDKQKGRNILIYTMQAISKTGLKRGVIAPSGLSVEIPTRQKHVDQVRIVNGRPLKSINQAYNKERARLSHDLMQMSAKWRTSHRLERLTAKRNRRVNHELHAASRHIVDLLVSEGIGTLIIGKNINWKQDANMGRRNNQNFVSIPHARFISMLTYKCELVGIAVIVTEESYTSKASFLDDDAIPIYGQCGSAGDAERAETPPVFSGKRVKRGLYRSASGKCFNADVNGSYNILRKVVPNAFGQGDSGCLVVHPIRLAV